MYPYDRRWKWWLKGRYAHLVDAVEQHPDLLEGAQAKPLRARMKRLKVWLVIRLILIALLSLGAIMSIVGALLRLLPAMAHVEAGLDLLTRVATAMAGLFAAGYFLANRTLGQLEIDTIILFHLEHHDKK